MTSTRSRTPLLMILLLATAGLLPSKATAQSAAELAPADVPVYIHIDSPAAWFTQMTDGPLGKEMRKDIESDPGLGEMLKAMGFNIDQFMAAYFGGDVVVLTPGEDQDGVIFTQVSNANRDHAIDTLALERIEDMAGYATYTGADGSGLIVMMDEWVALSDTNAKDYLESLLKLGTDDPRLADSDRYKRWIAELPEDSGMTMLAQKGTEEHHALGVVLKGKSVEAVYLGNSPDFAQVVDMLGQAGVADFGPLPASTIGAMSINILASEEMKENLVGLDALLGGKSFVDDVLTKMQPPMLMFMSALDGDAVEPKVGVKVPVFGVAYGLKDESAVEDLDRIHESLVLMANFAVAEMGAGVIPQRDGSYKGFDYRVAEIGKPLAKGLDFEEITPMQLVYGQVDDYYLICSQEAFFKQCIDAGATGKTIKMKNELPAHRLAKTPILAMTGRPVGLAQVLESWGTMVQEDGLPDKLGDAQPDVEGLNDLFDMVFIMEQYMHMKMQVWSGDDGLVIGSFQLSTEE